MIKVNFVNDQTNWMTFQEYNDLVNIIWTDHYLDLNCDNILIIKYKPSIRYMLCVCMYVLYLIAQKKI